MIYTYNDETNEIQVTDSVERGFAFHIAAESRSGLADECYRRGISDKDADKVIRFWVMILANNHPKIDNN